MNIHRPYDKRLEHRDIGAAALTATEIFATIDQKAGHRTQYAMQGFIEALTTSGTQLYQLRIELSNDDFATVEEVAAIYEFGVGSERVAGPTTQPGEFEILFSTERNGEKYRYWRPVLEISGGSASIQMNFFSSVL